MFVAVSSFQPIFESLFNIYKYKYFFFQIKDVYRYKTNVLFTKSHTSQVDNFGLIYKSSRYYYNV